MVGAMNFRIDFVNTLLQMPDTNAFYRMFSSRRHGTVSIRRITGKEDFIQYPQRMFGLPDLPFCNAPAFPEVSQKGFNILSGPVSQRFFGQKISKVFRPVHINPAPSSGPAGRFSLTIHPRSRAAGYSGRCWIKWRTIGPYPVLLRARPIGFPKRAAPSGIGDIHDFHHRNPLNINRLVRNKALYNRRNYHIII
jgi:hypothetical protein